jgi:hypothetical protein
VRNFIAGVVTGLVAVILAVWLYPWNVAATTEPTAAEAWLMTRLLERHQARSAANRESLPSLGRGRTGRSSGS